VKIGFDAKRIFCNFRGLGNYSRTLVEGLVKYYPDNEYFLFTPEIRDERAHSWINRFDQFKVVSPTTNKAKAFKSVWRSLGLSNVIKSYNLDIYHGLSHELPYSIKNTNCKSVVTIHDLIFVRYPEFFPWLDRKIYMKKFNYAVKNADVVIAICEQTKRDIIQFLDCPESKIKVVYQSCNPSFYEQGNQKYLNEVKSKFNLPDEYIFYAGALEERKNALSLLEAFSLIKNDIKQNLVLVGRGKSYKDKLEQYIENHHLKDRVFILSNVENDEMPGVFQMADLFVYPSHFEGWGVPIVESLFSEVPVITSSGSCFSESGGPKSIYVSPGDVDSLKSEILNVLSDDNLSSLMKREGRLFAEQFHQKKTSESLMSLYLGL
jgi:glycosyltransferase involved in cell wall biosynthesis